MIGERFGRLTVVGEAERYITPKTGKPSRRWRCECACGGETITKAAKLKSGHTQSCGCLWRERITKHAHGAAGAGRSRVYRIWDAMVQRCHNPAAHKFDMYGGRGITVCDRWRVFENFLADMGEPARDLSIDRIDNSKGYSPSNCRWATRKQQQRNMRSNHIVTYRGRRMSVSEAAELAGVKRNSLYPLLNHHGLSIEQAIKRVGG